MNPFIATILGKWKIYAAVLGALALSHGVVYYAGYNKADTKWRNAIADSKPHEVSRDTAFVPQPTSTGTFTAQTILDAAYRRKVDKIVRETQELVGVYQNETDSLRAKNANLSWQLQLALEPKLIHLVTAELGDLVLRYYPADSTANVYTHIPPPQKVVTVYQERLVLEPQSIWTTVGHVTIGVAIGVVTGYVVTHK